MSPTPDQLITPSPLGEGRFSLHIPDGWQQGRGAFGGLLSGALARAAEAMSPAPLRGLEVAMLGPATPGEASIEAKILRRGSSVTGIALTLTQAGEVVDHAIAVTAADRPGAPSWSELAWPAPPAWRDLEPLPAEMPFAPTFTRHLEYRLVGRPPYQGGGEASASGWVRARQTPKRLDAAWIALLVDAWWTGALARFEAPRPVATLTYALHLCEPATGLDPAAPCFLECRAPVSAGGYVSEERRLWGEDGRLLAINHQLITIIR